ncbi:RagB/SusD family nutrient uptake outer membrane protein [Draconibacterium sp.]|uniref:RagB/SusD family nutrient uptake outer membrane protein n=1 Tax=Draconibacterium sp. TaxID=1965318 RepID=UPI003568019A
MKRIEFIILLIVVFGFTSCDFLDPRPIQDQTTEDLWSHATYGEGILTKAYYDLESNYPIRNDFYTDNAVPNTTGLNNLALGSWTVQNNQIGEWDQCYENIRYLNLFLENAEGMPYKISDPQKDSLIAIQRTGEAYFLRAWYQWKLLRDYGGYATGETEALGFPIVTHVLGQDEELDIPRNTYEECVEQIVSDCDEAIAILPNDYLNGDDELTGLVNRGRASALAAKALKARMFLYAASPAYSGAEQSKWERAASAAAEAIEAAGGLTDLVQFGNFNNATSIDNIWISPTWNGVWEGSFYPPSLYGTGLCNPSQELVDAFPAKDGYPIVESAVYKSGVPYKNRDGRFERFIFFNQDLYNSTYIKTVEGGADAPGGLSQNGTRTGYYMKKLMSKNVRLTPGDVTSDVHFYVRFNKTELYLNFAEAANEAYGPTDATLGFSALEAMQKIRERAGIDSDLSSASYDDAYLEAQAAAGKDAFRELIKNERRLELCFEGHRFWDIRRWNEPLNHTVSGVRITVSNEQLEQEPFNVALASTPSTDYVSGWEDLNSINNGYENPTSSTDHSRGIYGNWYSGGEWRYVQYDFPEYLTANGTSTKHTVDQSDIYWFADGGGLLAPDSIYIQYWDDNTSAWEEVENADAYGNALDQWNTTTFDPVSTSSIRINFKNNVESCGIIEWQVWGVQTSPANFNYEYRTVENHTYQDYMRYIPVPYTQTLIMSNLKQNSGW